MEQRKALKRLLDVGEIVVAPGAYDALTALLVERAGFPAMYLTGSGVSYSMLGRPDLGIVSQTEMRERLWHIVDRVSIPVIADADTGYGGVLNVRRTVREYERAGASAIQLEDQVFPKRCGHYPGKQLAPLPEMIARIKCALDVRTDERFLIIARTDAIATDGFERAIERAVMYAESGADIVFVEAPVSVKELASIPARIPAPVLVNMVEGGLTPYLTASELGRYGYRIVIFPNAVTRAVVWAADRLLATLRSSGTAAPMLDEMFSFGQLSELVGLSDSLEYAAGFDPPKLSDRG
jgi:2-methylisocitrate lyase-like PEP mutase family enzyme